MNHRKRAGVLWLMLLGFLLGTSSAEESPWVYLLVPAPAAFGDEAFELPRYEFFLASEAQVMRDPNANSLVICAREGDTVRGTVAWKENGSYVSRAFDVEVGAKFRVNKARFDHALVRHYQALLDQQVPGGPLFRARLDRVANHEDRAWRAQRRPEVSGYDLISGGRAVLENLQLHRHLPESERGARTIALSSLAGITVKPYPWKVPKTELATDRLAALVPADQHAAFFASPAALASTLRLIRDQGTPLLRWIEPRAEDLHTLERYQRQLGFDLGGIEGRTIAVTGSDLYFEEGTDVAILIEGGSIQKLAKPSLEKTSSGTIGAFSWVGYRSPSRDVSSYRAQVGDVAVVSNSRAQLQNILGVATKKRPALVSEDEYLVFRARYPVGQDDAFALLPDAAIRRWSSPRWRIASARRRAALSEILDGQCQMLEGNVSWDANRSPHHELRYQDSVTSRRYGSVGFLTPIAELEFTHVSASEAKHYAAWRDTYQSYWSTFFDPIAIRLRNGAGGLDLDVSVIPLIENSDYKSIIGFAGKAKIAAGAGDRHSESLWHLRFALDAGSKPAESLGDFFFRGIEPRASTWLGSSWSVYVDRSPFFEELVRSGNPREFLEKNAYRFPGAIQVEVRDAAKLGQFLTALRAEVIGSFGDRVEHSEHKYGKMSYTRARIHGPEQWHLDKLAIYYAVTKHGLTFALDEALIKRAIDRHNTEKAKAEPTPPLGEHVTLHADREMLEIADRAGQEHSYLAKMRTRCYRNLHVLNALRAIAPRRDPVAYYREVFGGTLVCPAGGNYVWNPRAHTMQSTKFGHPADPLRPDLVMPYRQWRSLAGGVTFDGEGVRARVKLTRSK